MASQDISKKIIISGRTSLFLCFLAFLLVACRSSTPKATQIPLTSIAFPKIDRHPAPANWERGVMKTVPTYDPAKSGDSWPMDLRAYDLSTLDLRDSLNDLMYADFDDRTVWPPADRMPPTYDWQRIMELGKNPGLGIRSLHEQGITGRGIGIAVIDQTLLVDHQEYASQLRLYEELDDITGGWLKSQMHGPAVASIAVGKTVGVAPEADLYYIATSLGNASSYDSIDFNYLARAVRRILDINQQLPADRKIRVIAIAVGWTPGQKGYDEITAAVNEAKAQGLLVICSSIETIYGFKFHGLERAPLADPEKLSSYEPGLWWAESYYGGQTFSDRLLVPMDSRSTASPLGTDEYAFYREGGWSWSIPYIAGMYALAAQVDPTITPDRFWNQAMKTGRTIELPRGDKVFQFGPILDPAALIEALK